MSATDLSLSETRRIIERSKAHIAELRASVAKAKDVIRLSQAALAARSPLDRLVPQAEARDEARFRLTCLVATMLRAYGYEIKIHYGKTLH